MYVIPKSSSGKLSITRYNPETRYRDRYWTYQTKLIKSIVLKSRKPTVLIINQPKEKQKLYDYFTSQKYFVPDFNASLIRQVNLLVNNPSSNKVIGSVPDMGAEETRYAIDVANKAWPAWRAKTAAECRL